MKKLKFVLVAIALLAIPAAFAFTQQTREVKEWQYDGTGSTILPENYMEVTSSPSCEGTTEICTVIAPDDGNGHPDLSDAGLQSRIQNKDDSNNDVFLKD